MFLSDSTLGVMFSSTVGFVDLMKGRIWKMLMRHYYCVIILFWIITLIFFCFCKNSTNINYINVVVSSNKGFLLPLSISIFSILSFFLSQPTRTNERRRQCTRVHLVCAQSVRQKREKEREKIVILRDKRNRKIVRKRVRRRIYIKKEWKVFLWACLFVVFFFLSR